MRVDASPRGGLIASVLGWAVLADAGTSCSDGVASPGSVLSGLEVVRGKVLFAAAPGGASSLSLELTCGMV